MIAKLPDNTGLFVVDVQNDFISGTLPVPGALHILPEINYWITKFDIEGKPVYYSLDWHPETTPHFDQWPVHCVENTLGALNHQDVLYIPGSTVVYKGQGTTDGYSPFEQDSVVRMLREDGVEHLYVIGIAFDYCVMNTALDARKHGLKVTVIQTATASVAADTHALAEDKMLDAGIDILVKPVLALSTV